jgi:hypothetical protein
MKDKSYFLRNDLKTYTKKFLMLCDKCVVEIPQKIKETEDKRPKTIIITENIVSL